MTQQDKPRANDARRRKTVSSDVQDSGASPAQEEMLRWIGSVGAVSAEALAWRLEISIASARARLAAARHKGWTASSRPLADRPTLHTATRTGLRACGARGIEPARVSAASAAHMLACAHVAAALERCYPDHRVLGERELCRMQREHDHGFASAPLAVGAHGERQLHRCDLVLWPRPCECALPVAVEVELTIKAPARLASICRAWARSRDVAGVLYLAPADVVRALERAVDRAHAGERVVIVALEALPWPGAFDDGVAESFVPSEL